ncbi:putative deoxyribonuclease YjjV [Vibrio maritimus]|uniref:Putative deoxyribonuclease YjjV n=1 Tax=Vibrio maritimus TaxID=990268 RepID=A0A090T2A0_9VIBR|nr:putative deoxyribonuclease YjjV [Vibrio maritimus]
MIDSHCHLDLLAQQKDLQQVLSAARQQGVEKIIVPAINESNWATVQMLSEQNDDIYYALGFHPQFLDELSESSLDNLASRVASQCQTSVSLSANAVSISIMVEKMKRYKNSISTLKLILLT